MTTRPHPSAWFWLLAAPLSVVVTLLVFRNLLAVFAVYHVGFCLVLPAAHALLVRRIPPREHLRDLALTGPRPSRAIALGLGLGALLGGGTILAFEVLGDLFLRDNTVSVVLSQWGAGPEQRHLVFWFMVLVNGPAEELYWRGFVHTRLYGAPAGGASRGPSAASLLLPSFCYASYHGVTVLVFLAQPAVAVLFLAVILGAGWGWAWLRRRTGSVWPALLAHAGAVAGYMIVARPLLWD
jgi:membrane protease YdiL (CAAX protease family)